MNRILTLTVAAMLMAAPAAGLQGPTVVRFGAGDASLSAQARTQLDAGVVRAVREGQAGSLILAGHADRSEGSSSEAVNLSQRRAVAVQDYLIARGVPASLITTQAFGATREAVVGRSSPDNRRVEVTIGPASGW